MARMSKHRRTAGEHPKRRSSWLRNRETLAVILLAALAIVLYAVMVPVHTAFYGGDMALTMLFSAAATAAPLIALRYPNIASALLTVAIVALPLLMTPVRTTAGPWPWTVPLLLTFVAAVVVVTIAHGWRRGLVLFVLGSVAGVGASTYLPATPSGNTLIVTTSIGGATLLAAALVAGRLRVGAELDRQRLVSADEQQRRMQIEERTRIARELHDVVAHSMSVIQVQASTARYRLPDLPDIAVAEFDDLAATARSSLTEMRRLLGVLRTDDHQADVVPQQGIEDIPDLVDSIRRAGVDVRLELIAGNIAALPPGVQITAFRIAQESLSNAVRHAPGSPIDVRIWTDATTVRIRVHNDVESQAGPVPSGGHGLQGMRERVALLDGTLETGPDADGGWTIAAVLPWASSQEDP